MSAQIIQGNSSGFTIASFGSTGRAARRSLYICGKLLCIQFCYDGLYHGAGTSESAEYRLRAIFL